MPATLVSRSPLDGAVLGEVAQSDPAAAAEAVRAVGRVQPIWAQLTLGERGRYLQRVVQVVIDEAAAIRDLIARERGRPRTEAFAAEVLPSLDVLEWVARAGPEVLAGGTVQRRPLHLRAAVQIRRPAPCGVVVIVPPVGEAWRAGLIQVALTLMAGNGAIVVAPPETPLIVERIGRVVERAGVPEGLVRILHGPELAAAAVRAGAGKLFFTGPPEEGHRLAAACAEHVVPCSLRLEGKPTMVLLGDAPVERAVEGALWSAFAGGGLDVASVERVLVPRRLAGRFVPALVKAAGVLRVGDPLDWESDIGPFLVPAQRERALALVQEAVAGGAEWHGEGGSGAGGGSGALHSPVVLSAVRPEMRIMHERLAAPVVCVTEFATEEEALALAALPPVSPVASVWTSDRGRGERFAAALAPPTVWINDHGGLGLPPTAEDLLDHAGLRQIVWQPPSLPHPWRFPYNRALAQGLEAAVRVVFGRPSLRARALREGGRPLLDLAARLARGSRG